MLLSFTIMGRNVRNFTSIDVFDNMIIYYNIQYRYRDTMNVMAYQTALCSLPKPLPRDDFFGK